MRNQHLSKTTYVVSCDPDIKAAFLLKYRGTGASIIESFMRDMCGIDNDVLLSGQDEEEQLQSMAESIAAEKHKLSIQLKGLEQRQKEISEKKRQEAIVREEQQKVHLERLEFEADAKKQMIREEERRRRFD